MTKKGVFLVRFLTMDSRDKVLSGRYFFDSKPLILKAWSAEMDMEKEDVQLVPIWVKLKLNFKYWGEKSLFKIVIQLGKPIKKDNATCCRDKLQYARVMVDVPLSQKLHEMIIIRNENGVMTKVSLHYEWRPTVCGKCTMIGHVSSECRQGKSKRVWVRKNTTAEPNPGNSE